MNGKIKVYYLDDNLEIISSRTRNPDMFADRIGKKVYLKERFAKTARTRLLKNPKKESKRVYIWVIENGQVVKKRTRNPSLYKYHFKSEEEANSANVFDYTMTKHSLSIVLGTRSETITATDGRFNKLRKACIDNDLKIIEKLLDLDKYINKGTNGVFKSHDRGKRITIDNKNIPSELSDKIAKLMKDKQPVNTYTNFWKKLKENPDKRVRDNLYKFLSFIGCAFVTDGRFLAYKYVDENYKSMAVGIENVRYDWTPGNLVKMDRSKCNSDPNKSCSAGLHVGTFNYTLGHTNRLLICINPKNVVSVPNDYHCQKMRLCEAISICRADKILNKDIVDTGELNKWKGSLVTPY
ncbi:MAG: hypothetical protein GF364_19265 [Candidatus Lokiarchaeota archaeon]|nr:hypothetical protein [Candidatus Lokiarchaeota archaeon]